jgi:GT2 family glycosyltransferase
VNETSGLAGLLAPVDVLDLDLDVAERDGGAAANAAADAAAGGTLTRPTLVLVRRNGVPLATFTAPAGTPRAALAALATSASRGVPAQRRPEPDPRSDASSAPGSDAGADAGSDAPAGAGPGARLAQVAVVITTIRASEDLLATVGDAMGQSLTPAEIVVVDNRPATSGVRALLDDRGLLTGPPGAAPAVRYVAEPAPGLSRARNAGLAAVRSEFVAFTDDDVRLDRRWLARLTGAFADDVDCVTGLVMPKALHTEAQLMMERFGGFAKGLTPRRFDLGDNRGEGPLYPFAVGTYGTGANAAFRTAALRELGGFDPALGTGRLTRGGEDLDVFLRIVLGGAAIGYEPAAVVWHDHEAELDAFTQRVWGYGVGLGAVLGKHLLGPGEVRRAMLHRVPAGLRHLCDPRSPKNAQKGDRYPRRFTWLERAGIVVGPFAYLAATRGRAGGTRRNGPARGRTTAANGETPR